MAVSRAYKILWSAAVVSVILPHLNLGLLSDYKICGEAGCESPMSRVRATRDHHGKDCRFLSFRRGDTIFVYHKLTGKRDDLWAGSIDKQFGYFPKDAVQEEQVHATMEKLVETQKSDFFCMDEFGYPIDSSHLDNDDDEDAEKFQNQGSETTQTSPYTDDTNAGSPSISEDVSTEPPASAQEADSTLTEEDKSKNAGDVATSEEQEAPAASNEQGGSASSPWLGSSVTGWLGLATEDKPGNLDGGGEKDESKETQADASFTTSLTGWLGLGGEGQAGDADKSGEEDKKTAHSFTSSMTGWLGFGGEKETVQSAEKESDDEQKNDEEPEEKFRSRRMSLDLEGSQLREEEEKEIGTLDWLGNGLSNTMGFGLTNQESEHKTTTVQEKEEHSASSSWFGMGIGNILAFNNKDNGEADESTGSSVKEAKGDETLGPTDSENADTSQSQLVLTEEVNTDCSNESNMEETPEDQNVPSDTETMPGLKVNEIPTDTYQDFVTQPRISLEPGFSTVDSNSNSIIQAGDIGVMDKTEDMVEQRAEAPNQVDNTEESADLSGTTVASSDGRGDVENNAEADALHREIYTTQTDKLASQVSGGAEEISGESPAVLSSGTAEERNEPLSNQEDSFTSESEKNSVDNSDHSQPVESSSAEFGSAHSANINTEIISTNASEEDRGTVSTSESTTQMEDDAHHSSVSTHHHQQSDGDELTETEKDMETEVEEVEEERQGGVEYLKEDEKQEEIQEAGEVKIREKQQEVEKQVEEEEENQTDTEDLKEEEKQDELQEAKDIKTQEKQQKVEEEKQDGLEDLNEEEKQQEVKDEMKNGKQEEVEEFREAKNEEEIEEFKEEAVEESVEKGKQDELEEIKEEDKQEEGVEGMEEGKQAEEEELKVEEKKEREEVEELKGEENQEEVEELKEAEKWEEANELKQEEKQQQIEELEEEKWEDVEELKEEERREELKEVEKEEKEHEEKQAEVPQLQTDVNRPESESNDKEIQDERSSESESTQTEWSEMENTQMEEKEVKDVVKDLEVAENYEFDGMDKEEEENLKCSNELCPYSSVDGFVKDSDDFASSLSSTDEGKIETGEQNATADNDQKLADLTGGSQSVPSESLEREEDRTQEEQEREADEGKVEEGESHQTWNEDVTINNANSIPDNSLKDNQIEEADNDLLHSAKTGLENDIILCQTAGNEAGEQTDPSDVNNINLSDDHVIHQEEKAQSEDIESSTIKISTEMRAEQIHSDHKRDTEEDTDWEQRHDGLTVNTNGQVRQSDGSGDGTEFRARGGTEDPVSVRDPVEHQAVLSEHVVPHMSQHLSKGHNGSTAETESEGAFGMFKNAFGYFSKRKESTESDPSLDSNTDETTDDRESVSPKQELDPIQVQDLHTESPIILSQQQQQHQPTPPPSVQTSATPLQTLSHSSPPSPNTGSPLKTKTLSKHYTKLLAYMNADEMTVFEELFGRHKLQFLDYILGSTETMTDDDESILSDIERLLHHQRETLVAPSLKLTDAPQEDKEKTRTLIALQKLQMLLERVKETFNRGKSDVTNTNHQGLEDNTSKNKWMEVDQQKDGQLNGDAAKKGVILRGEKEIRSPNAQPGPPQSLEGVMKQILDFAHQIAEDSTTHVHAMRELLILVTAEVRANSRFKSVETKHKSN